MKDGRSRYTYARIPVGTAIGELQGLATREYDEVGQKDLDHLKIDWKRYCELDAAGKLSVGTRALATPLPLLSIANKR